MRGGDDDKDSNTKGCKLMWEIWGELKNMVQKIREQQTISKAMLDLLFNLFAHKSHTYFLLLQFMFLRESWDLEYVSHADI